MSNKNLVRWSGVLLGITLGAARFLVALRYSFLITRATGWLEIIGGLSVTLTLLPLSIVGIFKPRLAAYSLVGCLAIAVLTLFGSGGFRLFASAGLVGFLRFVLAVALPYSAIAGLLLYASVTMRPSRTRDDSA